MNNQPIHSGDCEFCDEFAGASANSFAAHYANELKSRIVLKEENFLVLPSLGQIVPGYLLLVPSCHYKALGDMSLEHLTAMEALKTRLANKLRSSYGEYLFFEHGARTPDSGGCGISHAHLHLVPFPAEKDPVEELIQRFLFERVSNLSELKKIHPGKSYLYYESVHGEKYVFYPEFIPSQFVRRLLAEAVGVLEWDWRQCGREAELLNTLANTRRLLANLP
jgi:diadenosine tetraphosphate (Ap4A) HIT family hydrolase